MAHFAKLGIGNKVLQVVVLHNDVAPTEQAGIDFLKNLYKEPFTVWRQTSYNTEGGVHKLGGTPFRKNYAGIGGKYDAANDAFIPPKPYNSWSLNETTYLWEPPTERPAAKADGTVYDWDELNRTWIERDD